MNKTTLISLEEAAVRLARQPSKIRHADWPKGRDWTTGRIETGTATLEASAPYRMETPFIALINSRLGAPEWFWGAN